MCVNNRGVAMPVVEWHRFGFEGKCKEVEMCQLVTRSWYEISADTPIKSGPFIAEVVTEVAAQLP